MNIAQVKQQFNKFMEEQLKLRSEIIYKNLENFITGINNKITTASFTSGFYTKERLEEVKNNIKKEIKRIEKLEEPKKAEKPEEQPILDKYHYYLEQLEKFTEHDFLNGIETNKKLIINKESATISFSALDDNTLKTINANSKPEIINLSEELIRHEKLPDIAKAAIILEAEDDYNPWLLLNKELKENTKFLEDLANMPHTPHNKIT